MDCRVKTKRRTGKEDGSCQVSILDLMDCRVKTKLVTRQEALDLCFNP